MWIDKCCSLVCKSLDSSSVDKDTEVKKEFFGARGCDETFGGRRGEEAVPELVPKGGRRRRNETKIYWRAKNPINRGKKKWYKTRSKSGVITAASYIFFGKMLAGWNFFRLVELALVFYPWRGGEDWFEVPPAKKEEGVWIFK